MIGRRRVPPPPSLAPSQGRQGRVLTWTTRIVVSLVVVAGVGAGYLWWQGERIVDRLSGGDKAQVVADARLILDGGSSSADEVALPAPASARAAKNFLLIGSDTRTGSGGNSDTLILARLDDAKGTLSLLSIPRDLKVPIPRHSDFKVNGAYSIGGAALTLETVRDYFQVRINHFAVVDFAGFQDLVNALDGVYLSVDQRYFNLNDGSYANNYSSIDLQPGYQKLNGSDALAFARYRHKDSDYFRQARQQAFLSEMKRVFSTKLGPSNPAGLRDILEKVADATTSDISSLGTLIDLATALRDISPDHVYRFTVPARGWVESDGRYYLHADPLEVQEVMRAWNDPLAARENPPPQPVKEGSGVDSSTRETGANDADETGDDGGNAAAAISSVRSGVPDLDVCVPSRRPVGSVYLEEAQRAYKLNGQSALALSGNLGPGRSFLWMWSRWDRPPILDQAHTTKKIAGRTYRLYSEAGHLKMVAFGHGNATVWLTNTLRNDLSRDTMLAMARSCE